MLLKDRKIIVTGGPTREWFDPVRYITNASSGKMGIALADRAFGITANTVFIHGPVSDSLLNGHRFRMVGVESTSDMLEAVIGELDDSSVLIMSAAPADYAPVERSPEKIKKQDAELVIRMKKTPDILKNVASYKIEKHLKNCFIVGFAAETINTENYARGKLKEKDLDMICLNDVTRENAGFGVDTNVITMFMRDGSRIDLPEMSKKQAASRIFDQIGTELVKRGDR